MKRSSRRLLPAAGLLVAGLLGCASTPVERARAQDASQLAPSLPRSVAIRVQLDAGTGSLYGTKAEWLADIHRILEILDACARVMPEGQASEADMIVTIQLSRSAPAEPDIQPTGAFLDFLAWSTVPLLPLWIPDVNVRPELHVRLTRSLRSLEGAAMALPPAEHDADPVSTSYLDRRPFFSWPTLGAIFVPPFVFKGTDAEHVEGEIGAWVREATAVHVADIVRGSRREDGELLRGLGLQADGASGSVLAFTPGPGLRRVVARVDDEKVGQRDLKLSEADAARPVPLKLSLSLRSRGGAPTHVSVLAVGNRPGLALRYTVRVPREAAAFLLPGQPPLLPRQPLPAPGGGKP